jgi:hypothetical protein
MKSPLYYLINISYCWFETVLHDADPQLLWPSVESLLKKGGN